MPRRLLMSLLLLLAGALPLRAQASAPRVPGPQPGAQWVRFTSLDGPPATVLDAYLFRPSGGGRHPAVVFLHGCGGLYVARGIDPRERDWAAQLNARGVAVLMIDSFSARGIGETCTGGMFDPLAAAARAKDAYAGLLYLQMQPDIRPDGIALMGWSDGGGALLAAMRDPSPARPSTLPQGDFRGAIAVYPTQCAPYQQSSSWQTRVALLVLIGEGNVWTPATPCLELMAQARKRGSLAELVIYPGAYHDFDAPGLALLRHPELTTAAGVVPILGTDPAARADMLRRVADFLQARLGIASSPYSSRPKP